jgi:hypothetical protein
VKTENGERVVIVDGVHQEEVVSLSFLNYQSLESMQFLPFQKNSMEAKLILNICPHKNCNKYLPPHAGTPSSRSTTSTK